TWAMCAVDALGIAPMLDTAVTIDSADPLTAEPILVHAGPDRAVADPPGAVVFVGARDTDGPAAQVCCGLINFFRSRHSATRWAARHPESPGEILNLDAAAELARQIFGHLLHDE